MSGDLTTLLGVAAIWSIAVVTPGPNFFITAQIGLNRSRIAAFFVALGIALGTTVWGLAGFLGVTLLLTIAPWAYLLLKILGGGYLIYLGVKLVVASYLKKDGGSTDQQDLAMGPIAALRLGLFTNLANPKTAVFVTSLFASTLPARPTVFLGTLSIMIMVALSLSWYGAVAAVFSSHQMVGIYARARKWIDRIAGGIFVGFGLQLATSR